MVLTPIKMYTKKQRNIITRCLIKLSDNMLCDDVLKLVKILSQNGVFVVFDYSSLSYRDIDSVLSDMFLYGTDFEFRCNNYSELVKFTTERKYVNYMIPIHVGFNADVSYRYLKHINSMSLDEYNMINYIKNDVDPQNVFIDLFVNNTNIFSLMESIKMFSENGVSSYVFFLDYPRSGCYDNVEYTHKNTCVCQDINYRLILDHILSNNNLKIVNKNEINFVYERCLGKFQCEQNKNFFNLVVDKDLKVRMCDNVEGKKCHINVFDCIDDKCEPTEQFLTNFKEDYKMFCYGCNCCCLAKHIMGRI